MTAATLKQIATAAAIEKNDIHMVPTSITASRANPTAAESRGKRGC
jgi:hypothetical protein